MQISEKNIRDTAEAIVNGFYRVSLLHTPDVSRVPLVLDSYSVSRNKLLGIQMFFQLGKMYALIQSKISELDGYYDSFNSQLSPEDITAQSSSPGADPAPSSFTPVMSDLTPSPPAPGILLLSDKTVDLGRPSAVQSPVEVGQGGTFLRDDKRTLTFSLLLGRVELSLDDISAWTDEQCDLFEEWAMCCHLEASDNLDVSKPPMPDFVKPFLKSDVLGQGGTL